MKKLTEEEQYQVRCSIPGRNGWLVAGEVYTVVEVWDKNGDVPEMVCLKEFPGILWGDWRFGRVPK